MILKLSFLYLIVGICSYHNMTRAIDLYIGLARARNKRFKIFTLVVVSTVGIGSIAKYTETYFKGTPEYVYLILMLIVIFVTMAKMLVTKRASTRIKSSEI